MKLPFWSDKDRLFVFWGLGMSLNFKFIARKLGLVEPLTQPVTEDEPSNSEPSTQTRQDHLREQIEASKYEERTH